MVVFIIVVVITYYHDCVVLFFSRLITSYFGNEEEGCVRVIYLFYRVSMGIGSLVSYWIDGGEAYYK